MHDDDEMEEICHCGSEASFGMDTVNIPSISKLPIAIFMNPDMPVLDTSATALILEAHLRVHMPPEAYLSLFYRMKEHLESMYAPPTRGGDVVEEKKGKTRGG